MTTDTFDRSCAHWSEDGRTEMERFYAIASVDYEYLARSRDWKAWLRSHGEAAGDRPLRLLDVACGSGKFPRALNRIAGVNEDTVPPVDYALLDPSRFSIDEARAALEAPFVPGDEHECTLQALRVEPGAYDVSWATHALYAVPASEIEKGLQQMIAASKREAFIAHALSDGHYIHFQRLFLEDFERTDAVPYTWAEQIISALDRLGVSYEVEKIAYTNGAPQAEREVVEGYLQRCLFDDSVTLEQLEKAPKTGAYLDQCLHDGQWTFQQRVALISIYP